jgi:hypothetical protein
VKPARRRKARRSWLLSCGHYVTTGTMIVNRGSGWLCIGCALAAAAGRAGPTHPITRASGSEAVSGPCEAGQHA